MPPAPADARTEDRQHPPEHEGPLGDSVYLKIKAAIVYNDLPPGSHVTEQQIAAELNVSRTPVHQAIVRLDSEGWLKLMPKRGILISTVTADEMRFVYEVLMGLEGIAVERLASRPAETDDPADEEMSAAATAAEAALAEDDLGRWAVNDDRFHTVLVERSGNPHLASMARTVMEKSHRARLLTLLLRPPPVSSNRDHRAILAAIRRRDPAAAKAELEAHRRRGMEVILPILARQSAPRRFVR